MSGIKANIRKILSLLLMAVFLVSGGLLLKKSLSIAEGEDSYVRALELAKGGSGTAEEIPPAAHRGWIPAPVEDDENMALLAQTDLEALREVNPEVLGWIMIPGSGVDYPLVQGGDNEYYLSHTWDGEESGLGAIFLEQSNSPDLTDRNSIIYGHNINDGSMFSVLKAYGSAEFLQQHPYIYLCSDAGVFRYEIFAAYKAPVKSITYTLNSPIGELVDYALEKSAVDSGVVPEENDRILTLSTCTGGSYRSRWVVQARLRMMEL